LVASTRHERALETALEARNAELKEAKRRARICLPSKQHRTLHLRATLPKKPEEPDGAPKRRYIKLPLDYTARDIDEAYRLALALDQDITDWRNGRPFNWAAWEKPESRRQQGSAETFDVLIQRLKDKFFEDRRDHPRPQTVRRYWQTDYESYLNKLDAGKNYNIGHMRERIESLPLNSSSRKKLSLACKNLMIFKGEPHELVEEITRLGRGYGKKQLNPRKIPTTANILRGIELIEDEWKWAFRVLYLYGCRPHELWESEVTDDGLLQINQGKTGLRPSMPRKGEKDRIEKWQMQGNQLPIWFGKNAEAPEQNLSNQLNRARIKAGIEWPAYNLRHAWAVQSIKDGINIRLAARSLGHSVAEHESTYNHWINEEEMKSTMKENM
jgi:integrase